jgi:hypothetical protein
MICKIILDKQAQKVNSKKALFAHPKRGVL